jgi:hypothetical protein
MRLIDRQTVRRAARGLPALLVAVLRQLALTTQWFPCDGRQGRRLRNRRDVCRVVLDECAIAHAIQDPS